jgi:hypothetical protein
MVARGIPRASNAYDAQFSAVKDPASADDVHEKHVHAWWRTAHLLLRR